MNYAYIEDGIVVQGESSLPKTFKTKDGKWITGFDCLDDETLKVHGWLPVIREALGENQRHDPPVVTESGVVYPAVDIPLEDVKAAKLIELERLRFSKETAGIVVDDMEIETDRESQREIMWLYIKAKEDKNGGFYVKEKGAAKKAKKIKGDTIVIIADAVFSHVQACAQRASELSDLIDTDVGTDITAGWPEVLPENLPAPESGI